MEKGVWKLGLILFAIGCLGVLSLLTVDIPMDEATKAKVLEQFTPEQFKLMTLLNPLIILIAMVLMGTVLHRQVNLSVPLLSKFVGLTTAPISVAEVLKSGVIAGLIAGALMGLVALIFYPLLPEEFIAFGESVELTLAARFLYGGLTEEILMRFGLMTFVIWLCSKIAKDLPATIYWIGIMVAALLFALGHFPMVSMSGAPWTSSLVIYILAGNVIGGVIFGWLYWKKGLEAAFVAHIFAHVVMVAAEPLMAGMTS